MKTPLVQPEGPGLWSMFEALLSQRSVLGLAALLAWLALFHALVDLWLLCAFTSLLVVLGGWLGSGAVLRSDSLLRLERLVGLAETPPSPEAERQLDLEIQSTIRKVVRDFVRSWYGGVSSGEREFETEVQGAMYAMALELKRRARGVDRRQLTHRMLELCGVHLQSYFSALELLGGSAGGSEGEERGEETRLWEAYSAVGPAHPAMSSAAAEVNKARAMVDLLLQVLAPPPHLETRTGRFVVGELVACNVLLPLVSKLSDPDWFNMLMVNVFTQSGRPAAPPAPPPPSAPQETDTQEAESPQQEEVDVPPCPSTSRVKPVTPGDTEAAAACEVTDYDVTDAVELFCPGGVLEEEEEEAGPSLRRYLRPGKTNPFYRENDSDLDSPLTDRRGGSMESLLLIGPEDPLLLIGHEDSLAERLRECATPTDMGGAADLEDNLQSYPISQSESTSRPRVQWDQADGSRPPPPLPPSSSSSSAPPEPDRELLLGVPEGGAAGGGGRTPSSPLGSFSFQPLSSPEGPVLIHNLRISGTITAKEHRGTGSHPYTLYTVKYETWMGCEDPPGVDLERSVADLERSMAYPPVPDLDRSVAYPPVPDLDRSVAYHTVNRRYSEFLNLQTRLEERPELRKILKNVKGPKKMFPDLPFGNMDSERVEARKGLLETFLKHLCAVPETANSEEMQEFLALNTDARIAFVKKPFIVSRIDKIVVNAIVDTLKTAFPRSEPQSPTEEPEGEQDVKNPPEKKSKSRSKAHSKMAPVLNGSDVRPQVLYAVNNSRTVCSRPSLADLELFLREQEWQAGQAGEQEAGLEERGRSSPAPRGEAGGCGCQQRGAGGPGAETALADVALNMVYMLLWEQWSWLCTENLQKTIRLLFGTLINRWLEVGVCNLTCTQYWVVYLRVLQEAVWPDGRLLRGPRPQRDPQQRRDSEEQALRCLMSLLPDRVSDLLGAEKYKFTWKTVLDSLQDPYINRHLVYSLCDVLLEFLVPESADEDFQKTLLHSLSKHHEKLPP